MQIVGRKCAISGQPIMMAAEGIGCRQCDVAYLRTEIPDTTCPQCHQDMAAQESEALLERQTMVEGLHRRGRARFVFVGVAVLLLFLLGTYGMFFLSSTGRPAGVPAIAGLIAWVWARKGNRGARWWLRGIMAGNLILCALGVSVGLGKGLIAFATIYAWVGITMAVALIMLFTRSLNLYLDDQYQHPQGRA